MLLGLGLLKIKGSTNKKAVLVIDFVKTTEPVGGWAIYGNGEEKSVDDGEVEDAISD